MPTRRKQDTPDRPGASYGAANRGSAPAGQRPEAPGAGDASGAGRTDASGDASAKEGGAKGTPQPTGAGSAGSMLPAVTLPTGGGAIRGIGEKFEVNAVTGTASLSIPLPISPGRGGEGPQVSLNYSSGSGNGPFGLGFDLSVPTITRKTDKGLPRYIDDAETDTYVLSGAEDLVPVLGTDGTHVSRDRGTHVAFRYRPRIEGLFARIERWVRKSDRDVHWQVTTPDNRTHVYGAAPNARIADPEQASHVFTWLLEETRDDKGNITQYEYKPENDDGVDPTKPSERSRFDYSGTSPAFKATAQRYLKRVRYGNRAPGDTTSFLFELVFDYGEHAPSTTTTVPAPEDPANNPLKWSARQDPFSTYRPGYEVRTYRLCQRVLMFHRFDAGPALLVRETKFLYEDGPAFTYLTAVEQAGYKRDPNTLLWDRARMPRLSMAYQKPEIHDELVALPEGSLEGLTGGVDGARKQWVDLDGEGAPGVLIDHEGGWFYKENRGGGELASPRRLHSQPHAANLAGGMQTVEDLDGDGRLELVTREPFLAGYFARTDDGRFDALRAFESMPNIDWKDPNLRIIDLDGDGHGDVLITEDQAFVWYRSRAKKGFESARRVAVPFDENEGPRVVFADAQQSIQLADMSGDGLVDIVRIRNGSVSYWPNLGYGRFGAKIALENAPVFAPREEFHASRVRLADIDGSGTTDLIYLGARSATLYFNQAGNRLGPATVIHSLPPVDSLTQLTVTDLLGTGTSCLVWSSPLGNARQNVFFVDLLGSKKPHLMTEVDNHLGAVTKSIYASSTKFYLEDKKAGIPWLTRLPFPVQVVERMERTDAISGGKLVRRYRYRHGFFDGFEREFRGFARVEQLDAEDFAEQGQDPLLFQTPVKTISWFHTGAWLEKERLEDKLAKEYFPHSVSPPLPPPLPPDLLVHDTILPDDLSVQDAREAARALKGSPLRQELYAVDGSAKEQLPYVITEQNQKVLLIQKSRGENRYGIFFAHPRETVTVTSERNLSDPRVSHEVILKVGDFGAVEKRASIVYGRATGETEQQRSYVTLNEADFANQANQDDVYRVNTQFESRTYEVTGLNLPKAGAGLVDVAGLETQLASLEPVVLDFDQLPTTGLRQRRLIGRQQQTFYADDLLSEAPLGTVGLRALPYKTYQLALTAGNVAKLVADSLLLSGTALDPAILVAEGKYQQRAGAYWAVSGRTEFSAAEFYLPKAAIDPFGNRSTVEWDEFKLLPRSATDALQNVVTAANDYRVLAPRLVTDPNLNESEVVFDALGMTVATAVRGKAGSSDGDPITDPTSRLEYDLLAYEDRQEPAFVKTIAKETHGPTTANTKFQISFAYSDGFGRVVQQKVQAEPGLAPTRNPDGTFTDRPVDPRWVGTGRTVFNNKGKPVKEYEPFFSATSAFEDKDDVVQFGVTPILRYDSIDRVIRTDLPDGTFTKVEFDSWEQKTFDPNDTVLESDWYRDRGSPPPGGPEPTDPDRRAAYLAAQHAGTPTVVRLDSVGRPILSIAHNRTAGVDELYETRTELDIEGNVLSITDARGNVTIRQVFDVLQRRLRVDSLEAGARLMLVDVAGKPLRSWDSRGQTLRPRYDALRRQTHLFVAKQGTERLLLRTVFGEAIPLIADAQQANLRGQPFHLYDCAGLITNIRFDFKGNLVDTTRRLPPDFTTEPNWFDARDIDDPDDILGAVDDLLGDEHFDTHAEYDALNRVTAHRTPDNSTTFPKYNEAGLLESLEVAVRGGPRGLVIENIDYNARGQRLACTYANPTTIPITREFTTKIRYDYDPKTFRLTKLETVRGSTTTLQHLLYTYDAVGNIVALRDMLRTVQETTPFFTGTLVESGDGLYVYDAIYRLLSATGREHPGLQPVDADQAPYTSIPHPNDLQALRRYVERYKYDQVGNIMEVAHRPEVGTTGGWTRTYEYEQNNNRLRRTSAPGDPQNFLPPHTYDEHGSMTSMPHLAQMDWDYADRLQHTLRANGGGPQNTYFTYDGAGERVRKVFVHLGLIKERIYLGGYEIYRERPNTTSGAITFERQTLHVMDDQRRVAMVETKTFENGSPASDTRWRFQLDNRLGSAMIELNAAGDVITYEEYHPYGSTAFHAATREVSQKRYRYTGKERDEETGLYYHGARYYAPWLGRWTATDPEGITDGLNLYRYSRDNPIRFSDPAGTQSVEWEIYQRFVVAPPRPPTPEERFRQIFFEENTKAPAKAHAQTLIRAFTDPAIPGQTATERFKAILSLTGSDPYLHFNPTIGATGTGRGPKAIGDTGFRPEFRDSALHRESSNQIGHFLTAADIGYANEGRRQRIEADEKLRQEHPILWGMSHQDQGAVSPELIDAAINETLVRAIVGHERYGDTQSAFETSYGAITSADVTDVKNFEAGRLDLIAVDPTKPGASRQDLLLSFVGYKFGTRVAQGMFASKEEAQRWLTTMLTSTKLESIKKEDPFFADAQQLLGILNKFQQQQQQEQQQQRRQQPQPQPQK